MLKPQSVASSAAVPSWVSGLCALWDAYYISGISIITPLWDSVISIFFWRIGSDLCDTQFCWNQANISFIRWWRLFILWISHFEELTGYKILYIRCIFLTAQHFPRNTWKVARNVLHWELIVNGYKITSFVQLIWILEHSWKLEIWERHHFGDIRVISV